MHRGHLLNEISSSGTSTAHKNCSSSCSQRICANLTAERLVVFPSHLPHVKVSSVYLSRINARFRGGGTGGSGIAGLPLMRQSTQQFPSRKKSCGISGQSSISSITSSYCSSEWTSKPRLFSSLSHARLRCHSSSPYWVSQIPVHAGHSTHRVDIACALE